MIATNMEDNKAKGYSRAEWYVIVEIAEGFHIFRKPAGEAVRMFVGYTLAGARSYMRSTRCRDTRNWVWSELGRY